MGNKQRHDKFPIMTFTIRLVLSCVILTMVLLRFGPVYVQAILPMIKTQIQWLHSDYEIHQMVYKENKTKGMSQEISVHISIVRRFTDDFGKNGTWRDVKYSIHASTLYSHPIIMFSLLLSWPGLSIKRRLFSILCGTLLLFVAISIDHPLHLISQTEKGLILDSYSATIREFWVFMLINGGRQFISVLLFLLAISYHYIQLPEPLQKHTSRNAPCPCGSGKKFKQCCGK